MTSLFAGATQRYHGLVKFFRPSERLQMTMFGPSGVGKTSLLASVYDQFKDVVVGTKLDIAAELDEEKQLGVHVGALKRLFQKDDLIVDTGRDGVRPNASPRAFRFTLGVKGKRHAVRLLMLDIPGGWLSERAKPGEAASALRALTESNAVMIPIDTPALLGRNGTWHHEVNQPNYVHAMFQKAYAGLAAPRLVVLAPMRCERYVGDGTDAARQRDLLPAVQSGYTRLLDFLGSDSLRDIVTVVVTPVQTLGGIELHAMHKDRYQPAFRKKTDDAQYKPVDNEQPLRYLLSFALRMYREGNSGGYFGFIRQLLSNDRDLVDAAETFAAGTNRDDPFAVLQGEDWLSIEGRSVGVASDGGW